ncbi:MAG: MlaD family protein [Fimbriimonadaceae bacterium]
MQGAAKVGLLVVVFVGLLIGAYALLGRSLFAAVPDTYYAAFEDAGGTPAGTPVLMAGVPIGKVEEVELVGPKQARMKLAIDKGTRIPAGSGAVISSSLIGFSAAPIEIVPPADPGAGTMALGATLAGTRKGAIEGLLPDTKQTVLELNKTIIAARELLEDKELRTSMTSLISRGSKMIEQFGDLAEQSQGLMASNKVAITNAVRQAELAMGDVRRTTQLLAKLIDDPRYKQQALEILASLNKTAEKADQLVASVNGMVNDPALRDPMRAAMANAEKVSESGVKIAASAERIADNADKITANGIIISEEVATLSKKANLIADEAREVLEKVKGFFDRTPGKGGIKPVEVGMDLTRETRPNYWRTDLTATFGVPGSGTNYHVGLFDAFESNKITAQIGRSFGPGIELRYGIYASKPGAGVDYSFGSRFMVRSDLFNINDPRLDLRIRYDFGNGIVGWAGLADTFGRNSPTFGVGVRK